MELASQKEIDLSAMRSFAAEVFFETRARRFCRCGREEIFCDTQASVHSRNGNVITLEGEMKRRYCMFFFTVSFLRLFLKRPVL